LIFSALPVPPRPGLIPDLRELLARAESFAAQAAQSGPARIGPQWIIDLLRTGGYPAIVAILLLCGLGLPVPEEMTLIGSGYLAYRYPDLMDWRVASAVCVAGILLGDTVIYSLGRRFGNSVLRLPIIRHELTPARLAKFDAYFERYGMRAIFLARFLMGVRLAAYFVAGRQRMEYWRFLLLDLAGAALTGPTSVFLGYHFGGELETAVVYVHRSNRLVIGLLVSAVVAGLLWARWRRRRKKGAENLPA
jgi:membrane protein DedA with SNARE-associated domain